MLTCGYRQNHRHLGRSLGLPAEILILAITDAITRASPYLVKSLHQQLGTRHGEPVGPGRSRGQRWLPRPFSSQ